MQEQQQQLRHQLQVQTVLSAAVLQCCSAAVSPYSGQPHTLLPDRQAVKLSAVCRLEDVFWLALKVQDISCFVTILSYYLCNNSYHVTGISIKRGLAKEAGNQGI